ncbi:MAG: sigma-70 family RNA polymerase sigma factor [Planctomycetes bacterium]|nr:sigma-70 family RNA polymerase sigma factor [Planctomycetota bacterium]
MACMKKGSELEFYLKEAGKVQLLTAAEEKEYARLIRKGGRMGRQARDRLIRANLRLVIHIAKTFQNRGLVLADLIEEGNLGLLKAVELFNPRLNYRFSTYAGWWIRQAIRRAIDDSAKTVHIPAHVVEMIAKWKTVSAKLTQKLGRLPEHYEVIKLMNVSRHRVKMFKRALRASHENKIASIDLIRDSAGSTIPDEALKPIDADILEKADIDLIKEVISHIDEKEAKILKMRYGLEGPAAGTKRLCTLEHIGKRFRCSREYVRQILNQTIKKLHKRLWRSSSI